MCFPEPSFPYSTGYVAIPRSSNGSVTESPVTFGLVSMTLKFPTHSFTRSEWKYLEEVRLSARHHGKHGGASTCVLSAPVPHAGDLQLRRNRMLLGVVMHVYNPKFLGG
jgi:hypothetical protein